MAVRPLAGRILYCGLMYWVLLLLLHVGGNQAAGVPALERVKRNDEVLYSSVCEGKTMNLRCHPGKQILVESANFGRTDLVTCVAGPNPIKTIDCVEPRSFEIVAARCNYKNYCMVRATSGVFGNPCPGTYKYLEVQFQCSDPPPTTRPPTTTPVVTTTTPPPTTVTPPPPSTTTSPVAVTTEKPLTSPLTPSPPNNVDYCLTTLRRGIQWPRTASGQLSSQPCPKGTSRSGRAIWHCVGNPAMWIPQSGPDLSRCQSEWIDDIQNKVGAPASEISEVMANVVESNDEIYGGDLLVVTDLMKGSLKNLKEELKGLNQTQKIETSKTVTKNYVKIGSSVLGQTKLESWQDLPGAEKTITATNLLSSIEESGFMLAENLGPSDTVTNEEGNVVLNVVSQEVSSDDFKEVSFPDPFQLTSSDWQDVTDSISIPKASLEARSKDGQSKVVFLAYNNLGSLLESNNYGNKQEKDNYEVNSRIISASIGDPSISSDLAEPAVIVFEHNEDNFSSPICSYWKFINRTDSSDNTVSLTGEWLDTGCTMTSTNDTHTVCSCTHLTNFAILMNTKGIPIAQGHAFVLSVITYFGFIISSVCLLLAFITFAYFKNLQNDRNTIHKNLCVCLLIAEIIFMAGIDQASRGAMCTVVAILLHYFFLAAFAWMCLEGIQLYVMLVEVFEAESSRRKYYYPFGYGFPLCVVGIAAAVDISSYGTDKYCWLEVENNFIWAFVAPVIVIIAVNTMFLSMAIFIMCRHSPMQTNQKEKTNKEKVTSWVRGALVLLCLLGITWAFGLLYVTESLLAFAYIFTIANVFQGVFIFLFHCFMNEKVVKEYRRFIRNSMWMPEWVRDRYGGTFFTGSNQQRSSSSSGKKRIWSQEEKRLSNTTGSCSVDHRKLSTSSNGRNSGEFLPVRFTASIPEKKNGTQRLSDEGIGLDIEDGHVEVGQMAKGTPSPPLRRNRGQQDAPASPTEVRPLLKSPTEPRSPDDRPPLPSYPELTPPAYQRPKSSNFTSLPDLAHREPSDTQAEHPKAAKKGSLPELPRSPISLRTRFGRMNSDSQRAGTWSPLDEQNPDDVDIADDNSGKIEFLGITNLSPRLETLI